MGSLIARTRPPGKPPERHRLTNRFSRLLYLALGWFSVGLGVLGIVFPLFPTAPFLLVAMWAFSRSSPELAERLRNHPRFGALIRNWQDEGVIPVKAKFIALAMMGSMLTYAAVWTSLPFWAVAALATVLLATTAYILTRPSRPPAT
jgi:uncharacterized protein